LNILIQELSNLLWKGAFYRTLQVNSKKYEYHIGKDFVKIKGLDLKNNSIPILEIAPDMKGIVKPGMISNFIQGIKNKPEDFFDTCSCKGVEKMVACLPFDLEIYEKAHYVYLCQECFNINAEDI